MESIYRDPILPSDVTSSIWQNIAPPRDQFVVWLLALKKLKIRDMIRTLIILEEEQTLCPMCNTMEGNVSHLYFECDTIWRVWMKGLQWWGLSGVLHSEPLVNIQAWTGLCRGHNKKKAWFALFSSITYTVLLEMNKLTF